MAIDLSNIKRYFHIPLSWFSSVLLKMKKKNHVLQHENSTSPKIQWSWILSINSDDEDFFIMFSITWRTQQLEPMFNFKDISVRRRFIYLRRRKVFCSCRFQCFYINNTSKYRKFLIELLHSFRRMVENSTEKHVYLPTNVTHYQFRWRIKFNFIKKLQMVKVKRHKHLFCSAFLFPSFLIYLHSQIESNRICMRVLVHIVNGKTNRWLKSIRSAFSLNIAWKSCKNVNVPIIRFIFLSSGIQQFAMQWFSLFFHFRTTCKTNLQMPNAKNGTRKTKI